MSLPPHPVVFCFAGQGSQYFRMGADLMESEPLFRQWMQAGDDRIRRSMGFSLLDRLYGPQAVPGQPFDQLEASHPAIFLVQYALAKVMAGHGIRPDLLLGVSLGEFTAQAVAGMVSFATALDAVCQQPALFFRTCPPGGMIAVLASPELHAASPTLAAKSELAGINSDTHFVLAALHPDLPEIEDELRRHDVPFQRLPVPFAFHSRFVAPAEQTWRETFGGLRRDTPFWPVWSACDCGPIGPADAELGWRIVRQGMKVQETIAKLESQGGAVYVDLSPSGTLAALLRQGLPPGSTSRLLSVLSPFGGDRERLRKTLSVLRPLAPTATPP